LAPAAAAGGPGQVAGLACQALLVCLGEHVALPFAGELAADVGI
jgi:hypothetical protein